MTERKRVTLLRDLTTQLTARLSLRKDGTGVVKWGF